jgi:hypothetical protein
MNLNSKPCIALVVEDVRLRDVLQSELRWGKKADDFDDLHKQICVHPDHIDVVWENLTKCNGVIILTLLFLRGSRLSQLFSSSRNGISFFDHMSACLPSLAELRIVCDRINSIDYHGYITLILNCKQDIGLDILTQLPPAFSKYRMANKHIQHMKRRYTFVKFKIEASERELFYIQLQNDEAFRLDKSRSVENVWNVMYDKNN